MKLSSAALIIAPIHGSWRSFNVSKSFYRVIQKVNKTPNSTTSTTHNVERRQYTIQQMHDHHIYTVGVKNDVIGSAKQYNTLLSHHLHTFLKFWISFFVSYCLFFPKLLIDCWRAISLLMFFTCCTLVRTRFE